MTRKSYFISGCLVLIFLWAALLGASEEPVKLELTAGKVVSIKEDILFMSPFGMIKLYGVSLPMDLVIADRERALDALNTWILGQKVTVIVRRAYPDYQLIEIIDDQHNYNQRLINERLTFANRDADFSAPKVPQDELDRISSEMTLGLSGSMVVLPEENAATAPAAAAPAYREIPLAPYLTEDKPTARQYAYDPARSQNVPLPKVELVREPAGPVETTPTIEVTRIQLTEEEMRGASYTVNPSANALAQASASPTIGKWIREEEDVPTTPAASTTTEPASHVAESKSGPTIPRFYEDVDNSYIPQRNISEKNTDLARQHYEQGREYHQKEQYDLAWAEYNKALEYNPYHPDAPYYLSQLYGKVELPGQKKPATEITPSANPAPGAAEIPVPPQDAPSPVKKAGLNEDISDDYIPPRDVEKSKTQMAQEHYEQGRMYHKQGETVRAREEYIKALELNPYHADAPYYLSQLYASKQDVENSKSISEGIKSKTADTPASKPPQTEEVKPTPPKTIQSKVEEKPVPPAESKPITPAATTPARSYAATSISKTDLMNSFNKAFREDDFSKMKKLVHDHPKEMLEFFDSLQMVLKQGIDDAQAKQIKTQSMYIANLFVSEHNDDSLKKRLIN